MVITNLIWYLKITAYLASVPEWVCKWHVRGKPCRGASLGSVTPRLPATCSWHCVVLLLKPNTGSQALKSSKSACFTATPHSAGSKKIHIMPEQEQTMEKQMQCLPASFEESKGSPTHCKYPPGQWESSDTDAHTRKCTPRNMHAQSHMVRFYLAPPPLTCSMKWQKHVWRLFVWKMPSWHLLTTKAMDSYKVKDPYKVKIRPSC